MACFVSMTKGNKDHVQQLCLHSVWFLPGDILVVFFAVDQHLEDGLTMPGLLATSAPARMQGVTNTQRHIRYLCRLDSGYCLPVLECVAAQHMQNTTVCTGHCNLVYMYWNTNLMPEELFMLERFGMLLGLSDSFAHT